VVYKRAVHIREKLFLLCLIFFYTILFGKEFRVFTKRSLSSPLLLLMYYQQKNAALGQLSSWQRFFARTPDTINDALPIGSRV